MFGITPRLSRRSFIGLGMGGLIAAAAGPSSVVQATGARRAQAKNVLVIFEQGGVSQMDTWDPKPDAVAEDRSPFRPIRTNVPGIQFTELLPETARADILTVIRCMMQPRPGIGDSHPRGSQYIFSGEQPTGPEEMPDISSVVSLLIGTEARHLPSNIMVPGTSEQQDTSHIGFLPPQHRVFKTGGRPHEPTWSVPHLGLLGIDSRRFQDRTDLLSNLDVGLPASATQAAHVRAAAATRGQAIDMLTNPATLRAFDLKTEAQAVRERYGLGHRGQCYLLGRKLIEAGVRFVTLDVREPLSSRYPGGTNMNWDHHDAIYAANSCNIPGGGPGAGRYGIGTWPMMGSTDHAFAALLDDMRQRGLLAETLICFVTEFGRTPKLNNRQGRDHWTHAFSFAFAGAGVPGGQVVGATDRDGGYITSSRAYMIEDYAATIYEKLGIDRSRPIRTPAGRPIYLASHGHAIPELF